MKFLKNRPGVSLVELSFVFAIMVILAVMATVRFTSTDSMKLEAASKKLFSDLQYLRHYSLTHPNDNSYSAMFNYNSTTNRYTLHQIFISTPITDPITKQPFIVDFDDIPEYRGVTLTFTPASLCINNQCTGGCTSNCTPYAITFFRGAPACSRIFGGWILMSSVMMTGNVNCATQYAQITLSIGSRTRNIYILPGTGKISFSNVGSY